MSEHYPESNPDSEPQIGQDGESHDAARLDNPYIGPRPFTRKESKKFGGRKKEVDQLLNLLIAERIVLMHSPSGAGKTSLIEAGLRPKLENEGYWISRQIRVNQELDDSLTQEGEDQVNRYVLSVLQSLEKDKPESEQLPPAELATLSLSDYLDQHLFGPAEDDEIVLIFDQFEEILTVDPYDEPGKQAFFSQLGEALRNRDRYALFAARADYLYGFERYERPIPTRLNNTYGLRLLEHESAIEAMRAPAAAVAAPGSDKGITFEEDAAELIFKNLSEPTPYVEPVQLQVVCQRLWDDLCESGRLDDGEIDISDVSEKIDVDEALSDYYCDGVATVATAIVAHERAGLAVDSPAATSTDDEDRELIRWERKIREWVGTELINKGGVRTQVIASKSNAAFADRLVGVHLVRKEDRRGIFWYELSHDRLVKPVLEDNGRWFESVLNPLQKQARLWLEADDDVQRRNLLLRGDDLVHQEQWAQAHEDELQGYEQDFLDASQKAEKARNDEMEAARREARSARRFKRLTLIAGGLLLIAAITGILAFKLSSKDRIESELAKANDACEQDNAAECLQAIDLAMINRMGAFDRWKIYATKVLMAETENADQINRACMNGINAVLDEERSDLDAVLNKKNIEREELIADIEVACAFAIERARDTANVDALNDLCSYGLTHEWNWPLDERDALLKSDDTLLAQACSAAAVQTVRVELDQMNLACQNAITAKLDPDQVEPSCRKAITLGSGDDTADLVQLNLACQNGLIAGLSITDVQPICWQAVQKARASDNLVQVNQSCQNALSTELITYQDEGEDVVRAACLKAADNASKERTDLIQVNLACQNVVNAGLVTDEVRRACGNAAIIASGESEDGGSEDLVQVNIACENAFVLGKKGDLVEDGDLVNAGLVPACRKAVDLAANSVTDIAQVNLACVNGRNVGIDAAPACENAVSIAGDSDNLVLVNQACQNGLEAGLADEENNRVWNALRATCRQAVTIIREREDSPNLIQVKLACENGFSLGFGNSAACQKLEELVRDSSELAVVFDLCRANASEPWSANRIQSACPTAARLASGQEDGEAGVAEVGSGEGISDSERLEVLDYVCLNGVGLGMDETDVSVTCREASVMALDADEPGAPILLSNLCRYSLEEDFLAGEASAICTSALSKASVNAKAEGVTKVNATQAATELCMVAERVRPDPSSEAKFWGEGTCELAGELVRARDFVQPTIENGDLLPGMIDYWPFRGEKGQIVTISMERDASDLSPVFEIHDLGGDNLPLRISYDDLDGSGAVVTEYLIPQEGGYVIAAGGSNDSAGAYELSVDYLSGGRLVGANSQDDGSIRPGVPDRWFFEGEAGQIVTISMKRGLNALDPFLRLLDPRRLEIAIDDDGGEGGDGRNALIALQPLTEDGQYMIEASGLEDSTGDYTLDLEASTYRELAADVKDASEAMDLCQSGLDAGQFLDEVRIVCERAADLALESEEIHVGLRFCSMSYYQDIAELAETACSQALSLVPPLESAALAGELAPDRPSFFAFDGQLGQLADIVMARESDELDPYLRLYDPRGMVLVEDHDSAGDLDARIRRWPLAENGTYIIEASDPRGVSGPFRLSLQLGTYAEIIADVEDASEAMDLCQSGLDTGLLQEDIRLVCQKAADLVLAAEESYDGLRFCSWTYSEDIRDLADSVCYQVLSLAEPLESAESDGAIEPGRPVLYSFEGQPGQLVDIEMTRASDDLDPFLTLYDPWGIVIAQDDDSAGDLDAWIRQLPMVEEGRYVIAASGLGDSFGDYSLSLQVGSYVELAAGTDDASEAMDLCQSGLNVDLTREEILSVCRRAADLAAEEEDAAAEIRFCAYRDHETIGPLAGTACDQAYALTEPVATGETAGVVQSGRQALYSFDGQRGQLVDIQMARENDDLDPFLTLYDPAGVVLAQDDDGAGDLNSWIRQLAVEEDGRYIIAASGLGDSAGAYVLSLQLGTYAELAAGSDDASELMGLCQSGLDAGLPVEEMLPVCRRAAELAFEAEDAQVGLRFCAYRDGDSLAELAEAACDQAFSLTEPIEPGQIEATLEPDGQALYYFDGQLGQLVDIQMTRESDGLDPYLSLYDSSGTLLAEDDDGAGDLNAWIRQLALAENESYVIAASGLGGSSGDFTLSLDLVSLADAAAASDDPYWLRDLCLGDSTVTLSGAERYLVCGRAGELAAEFGDIFLARDLCLAGQGVGMEQAQLLVVCAEAATRAIDEENTVIGYQLCSLQDAGIIIDEADRACQEASSRVASIGPGESVAAALAPGLADVWLFEDDSHAGQVLSLAMDQGAVGDIDPYLRLYGPDGNIIAEDDDSGGSLNSLIDGIILSGDDVYLIEASSLRGNAGDYTLSVELRPLDEHVSQAMRRDDPGELNQLCWNGSIAGFAEDVLPACERAVELAEEFGDPFYFEYADSRGLARALTGDIEGAIEDFSLFVELTDSPERRLLREGWIEELAAADNPFTDEVLRGLLSD